MNLKKFTEQQINVYFNIDMDFRVTMQSLFRYVNINVGEKQKLETKK